MKAYYAQRAKEYDEIYEKPERQEDIAWMQQWLATRFPNQRVLEVACGTGYWSQYIARSAILLDGIDVNPPVIELAQTRHYADGCRIRFFEDDAYQLDNVVDQYDAAFAGFWVSHIPKQNLDAFFSRLHRRLLPGAQVVMIDNRFVREHSTSVHRYDEYGNGYQVRQLNSGEQFEVLKNFPTSDEFQQLLSGQVANIRFRDREFFWILEYQLPN